MRAATLLLTALLLPTASAGWFTSDDPTTIAVAPTRAGDVLQYEEDATLVETHARDDGTHEETRREVTWTHVLLVEGPARASDKHGIERDTVAYRADRLEGETLVSSERCHALAGGDASVRRDHLYGKAIGSGWGLGQTAVGPVNVRKEETTSTTQHVASFHEQSCMGHNPWGGRTLREGGTMTLAEALGGGLPGLSDVRSAPAAPTTFHGRDALAYAFRLAEMEAASLGMLTFTFADGLPGAVRIVYADPTAPRPQRLELTGHQQGAGAEVPAPAGARLPDVNPEAELRAFEPRSLDTAAYGLAYPYADAYAVALADPTTGLKAFLDAHPDAILEYAFYMAFEGEDAGLRTTGGDWMMSFADGSAARWVSTSLRVTHAGPLSVPRPGFINQGNDMPGAASGPRTPPERLATSPTLAGLAAGHGVERVGTLSYFVAGGSAYLALNTGAPGGARDERTLEHAVELDPAAGALRSVFATETVRTSSGLLAPPAGGALREDAAAVSALSALAGPGVGVGLGVGAATGVALLVVAAKFLLVPLFTRLVRARLLDNPVRARLYERVRAEPGIRQAELVDYLGVGEGATRHHLAQLVRHRYVVESREGAQPAYYAAGEVPPDVARRAAVLRSASARRVYDAYAAAPGMSLREAAARLGMSAPSVHRQKRRLEAAGLLPPAPALSPSP